MKLSAHRAGLPGEEVSFILCPFLPAGRQEPRTNKAGFAGHVPVNVTDISSLLYLFNLIPAFTRSHVSLVTPSSLSLYFSTLAVGVLGKLSLNST